jgi:hypothetical protein
MTVIQGKHCLTYFRGKDGLGTCDDGCQWFVKGVDCPYWFTEEEYQVRKKAGQWNKALTVGMEERGEKT